MESTRKVYSKPHGYESERKCDCEETCNLHDEAFARNLSDAGSFRLGELRVYIER